MYLVGRCVYAAPALGAGVRCAENLCARAGMNSPRYRTTGDESPVIHSRSNFQSKAGPMIRLPGG